MILPGSSGVLARSPGDRQDHVYPNSSAGLPYGVEGYTYIWLRFSARVSTVSVSCTRGSNGPLETAEGDVRSIVTECPDVRAVHGKAPLVRRESTRPTSNGVNFREGKDGPLGGTTVVLGSHE